MDRSTSYLAAALGLALAMPVHAQDFVGAITNQLQDLGFEQIEVNRTLLGRTRIVASSPEGTREIIVSTNSDEILRDFWQAAPGKAANRPLVDNRNSGSGSGGDNRSGSDDSGSAGSDDGNDNRSGSGSSNDSGSDDSDSDDNESDDNDSDDSGSDDKDDGSDDSKDD
jgi:hypothetical protein